MASSFSTTTTRRFLQSISLDKLAAGAVTLIFAGNLTEAYTRTELADSQTPLECRYGLTSSILTTSHIRTLEQNQMVVIHNVLPPLVLAGARKNVAQIIKEALLNENSNNKNHSNDDDVRQDHICMIRETDSHPRPHGHDVLHCIKLLRGIPDLLNEHCYSKASSFTVPRQCQLAKYRPDGSIFVRHLDKCTTPLLEMGLLGWFRASDYRYRVVTCILYLNDPDWDSGGHLRCYNHNNNDNDNGGEENKDDETFQDINPTGGTLLIFDSAAIEHEVLPSTDERYALTLWVNGMPNE
jgi:2OG-Fe(II) oxygenase superfamily